MNKQPAESANPAAIWSRRLTKAIALIAAVIGPICCDRAWAGLAASDVAVVVNASSPNSRTLANHYIALRGIPSKNIIFLDSVPASESISLEDFKSRILLPVLKTLEDRQIAGHIQCIAYSADFPTAINIAPHLSKLGDLPKYITPVASINALTFFYQSVLRDDPSYVDFLANRYACRDVEQLFASPAGSQTDEAWENILNLVVDQKHTDAANAAIRLFGEHPQQYQLAYLAAAEFAAAGETEKAVDWISRSIAAGWHDGDYLAADKRFDSIRDAPQFQVAEILLEPNPSGQRRAWGFSARTTISPNGLRIANPALGYRYLLSVVLGVTRGQGSTLDEAIECLARASHADFSHPDGTFYFASTSDVRTKTRAGGFDAAIQNLESLGFDAQIVKSSLPQNSPSVLGAQIGTASTQWGQSGSQLVPGAIVDNLTSYGGVMNSTSQTKLTHFIASGAAGSSGTVTEPYALQPKFPHPQMYVHYAAGASLAEAFYLSTTGPYQLLIVGDPLCKPFSHAPKLRFGPELRQVKPTDTLTLNFPNLKQDFLAWDQDSTPRSKRTNPIAPSVISVLTDGLNAKAGRIQPRVALRMSSFSPGYHELTVRLASNDPLNQRSDWPLALMISGDHSVVTTTDIPLTRLPIIDTGDLKVPYHIPGADTCYWVSAGQRPQFPLNIESVGAKEISLWHEQQELQTVETDNASFTINTPELGLGPVRLWAKAKLPDGTTISSAPIMLMISR